MRNLKEQRADLRRFLILKKLTNGLIRQNTKEPYKTLNSGNKSTKEYKVITGTEFETIEEFETDLRSKYPDLEALEITQLYLVAKLDKKAIRKADRDLKTHSKVPVNKESFR